MALEVKSTDIAYLFSESLEIVVPDLTVPAGGELKITGSSGSGKSTLLEILGAVIAPTTGVVLWEGVDVNNCSRMKTLELELRSSIVFQQHALLSYLPLYENIALPLRHHQIGTKEEIDRKVDELIERFKLSNVAWNLPEALSVGERRLGAIARAAIVEPELICMDEPTEGLDDAQKGLFLDFYRELCRSKHTTVIMTSDDNELLSLKNGTILNLNNNGITE